MRYALIGCGRIAKNHIRAALDNRLTLCALCDAVPGKAAALLGQAGLQAPDIPVFADYREMLDRCRPELAAIATDSGSHAEIALECIGRGIPVLIEKPIALSMEDADAIVRRADETGVCVSVCHQNRFNEASRVTRGALRGGRLGRLSHGSVCVRWNRNSAYYLQAPWRGTWERDGGALMNQSIHGIDLLLWMIGDRPVEVFGMTRRCQHDCLEAEDVGTALIRFESGVIATVEGTVNAFNGNLEETLTLFGENGLVRLSGMAADQIDVWRVAGGGPENGGNPMPRERTENVYGKGHTLLYADMIQAVRQGRRPLADARAGRNALELVLAIYKSQLDNRPVALPVTGFSTRDMERALPGGRL